jgi:SAM-dependent methyltransferase
MQQLTGQAYLERYGHAWDSEETARDYVERSDRDAQTRAEGFRIMISLIPFEPTQPIRMLDVGTGQGTVAGLVLDAFPNARAVGLDVSEPMRAIAAERMGRYGDRFTYCLGDFLDGELPPEVGGPFDAVVAARSIHHLPAPNKRLLYSAIHSVLSPGGCFFNLDSIMPSHRYLRARIRDAGAYLRGETVNRSESEDRAGRPPTPGHYWDPLEDHLRFLREAGFSASDCFWKRLTTSLIGGYKVE